MTEQEAEIQALKERIAHLEGVIEGISRGMISKPQPLPWYGPVQPNTGWPVLPHYTVTC
jgi:hypothetical protein